MSDNLSSPSDTEFIASVESQVKDSGSLSLASLRGLYRIADKDITASNARSGGTASLAPLLNISRLLSTHVATSNKEDEKAALQGVEMTFAKLLNHAYLKTPANVSDTYAYSLYYALLQVIKNQFPEDCSYFTPGQSKSLSAYMISIVAKTDLYTVIDELVTHLNKLTYLSFNTERATKLADYANSILTQNGNGSYYTKYYVPKQIAENNLDPELPLDWVKEVINLPVRAYAPKNLDPAAFQLLKEIKGQ